MSLLRVKGTIDLKQFWPSGKSPNILSDADTVHVKIDSKTAFVYEGNVTHAFDYAWITTRKNKDGSRTPDFVLVSQATSNAHIKVRLQGIDAPELHYRIDQKKPEVRQNWGERATAELCKFLTPFATGNTVECYVETLVKSPNDAFDMYGRFVGDIIVSAGGKLVNINRWLVEHGWAFPTHYNSMQPGEIDAINKLWAKGGFHKSIVNQASNDMYGVPAGKAGDSPSDAQKDQGKVCLPKMFRRLVGFMEHPDHINSLHDFLAAPHKKSDLVIKLADFREMTPEQRANPKKKAAARLIQLHELVSEKNRLAAKPEDLVFVEEAALLKNSTGKVTSWTEQGQPIKII